MLFRSRKRQLVDAAMEGVCKCEGNPDGTVGVVALPDVQKARNAADRAEIKVIEAVLAAGERQNNGVLRRFFSGSGTARPATSETGREKAMPLAFLAMPISL